MGIGTVWLIHIPFYALMDVIEMLYPKMIIGKESKYTGQTAHSYLKLDEPILRINLESVDAIFQKRELQRKGATSKGSLKH